MLMGFISVFLFIVSVIFPIIYLIIWMVNRRKNDDENGKEDFSVDDDAPFEFMDEKEWNHIETVNKEIPINRENAYIDDRGYLRWKDTKRLCHRDIAFKHCKNLTSLPFGECEVHHVDLDKWNNNPENLRIVDRTKHDDYHFTYKHDRYYFTRKHPRR